jgi:hypothetical protein
MTATENIIRHCPKCGSVRVHRSRKRGPIERTITWLGADIRRCHDCRARQAWFGFSPIPIGNTDPKANPWAGILLFLSCCAGCFAAVWWLVVRFTGLSG